MFVRSFVLSLSFSSRSFCRKMSTTLDEKRRPSSSIADEKHELGLRQRVESITELPDPDAGKTPEERAAIDKALMRKVDLWLIPWLCLLYLLSFLDRTNIGNARLAGMELDLNMLGFDYNSA